MPDLRAPLLVVKDLQAWYGESHILHGVSFDVHQGEVVTLLGRNGAGKTTTLKSIMGIVGQRTGSVRFETRELIGLASNQIARAGIALCPEERGIFASLTVEENLMLPPVVKQGGLPLEAIFELFPNLKERLGSSQGTKLSGGEQQMLAIGRILRTGARLLLLDEPTEGLAPVIIQQIGRTIRTLKEQGFTILLVEQNFRFASTVADRYYVMEHGRVVEQIANAELDAHTEKLHEYLGGHPTTQRDANKEECMKRLLGMTALAVVLATGSAYAQTTVKIGILTDMSSLYADLGGPGSVAAAKLAVADFNATNKDVKAEIVSG